MPDITTTLLPGVSSDDELGRYFARIRRYPMLDADQEHALATRYARDLDTVSGASLVTSHLRLVVKIAMGYRGYGMPVSDLISEGNLGLVRAVAKFEPGRGARLSTYARWWIRAQIQEFILRSWSLVKIGTTASQKTLFFNLRRLKSALHAFEEGDLQAHDVQRIAVKLGVDEKEVVSMNRRMAMGGDASLNVSLAEEGESEWLDRLEDEVPLQDEKIANAQEACRRRELLLLALEELSERERRILTDRRLREEPCTLEDLSIAIGVSRERIRQIELRAFEKVQKTIAGITARRAMAARPLVALA